MATQSTRMGDAIHTSIQIYVDGGCNKHTGDEAWATALLLKSDGEYDDIFAHVGDLGLESKIVKLPRKPYERVVLISRFDDVKTQQNNGAELLAILGALIYVDKLSPSEQSRVTINSDSQLIVDYWSRGKINPKTATKMDPRKLDIINRCSRMRTIFERKGGKIVKISGDNNPADLGYH